MRIVGGEHRGRVLASPEGKDTRPTGDRARQALFNILQHAGWAATPLPQDAAVLDVFAGTGALGLEALSRGAAHAVFMENAPAAAALCRRNVSLLREEARAQVMACDALRPPRRPENAAPRGLIFLDPPYGRNMGAAALSALAEKGWIAPGAVCVLEMSKKAPEETPPGFLLRDTRSYGIALLHFMTAAE